MKNVVLVCVHDAEEHLLIALPGRSHSSLLAIRPVAVSERTERFAFLRAVVYQSHQRILRDRRICIRRRRIRFYRVRAQPPRRQMVDSRSGCAHCRRFSRIALVVVSAGGTGEPSYFGFGAGDCTCTLNAWSCARNCGQLGFEGSADFACWTSLIASSTYSSFTRSDGASMVPYRHNIDAATASMVPLVDSASAFLAFAANGPLAANGSADVGCPLTP